MEDYQNGFMRINETETLSYEIFNLDSLKQMSDLIAKAFTHSEPLERSQ